MLKYCCLILILSSNLVFGTDSLRIDTAYYHNTSRAALLSAVLPGAGQIYNEIGYRNYADKKNRAWWKVPIIYAGLGACGYYFYHNNKWSSLIKQEYLFRENNDNQVYDQRLAKYESQNDLINGYTSFDEFGNQIDTPGFNLYSKRRDIFIFAFIGVWGINVVEAFVDAHFVSFDVSEDLSLNWSPVLLPSYSPGLNLTLTFN
jgi:hypothetical protein